MRQDEAGDWRRDGGIGGLFGSPADDHSEAFEAHSGTFSGPDDATTLGAGPDEPVRDKPRSAEPDYDAPDYDAPEYDEMDDGEPGYGDPDYMPGSEELTSADQAPSEAAADAAGELTPSLQFPARRRAPSPGWRRTVYRASGGTIRIPTSPSEMANVSRRHQRSSATRNNGCDKPQVSDATDSDVHATAKGYK